jgi:hypothetical protein
MRTPFLLALLATSIVAPVVDAGVIPVVVFNQWTDPVERAFTLNVPADWVITGGSARRSAVDIRQVVRASSSNGDIQIFLDDPNIIPRQVPNMYMMQAGMREGQIIQGGWGGPVLVQRYRSGAEYARDYTTLKVCPARFTGGSDLAAETADVQRQANTYAANLPFAARGSAGDAYFRCGDEYGYVTATTIEVAPRMGAGVTIWAVLQMGGFRVKRAEDVPGALYILHNMLATFKIDAQWQARSQRDSEVMTATVTRMQNAMMSNLAQQSASRANSERSSVVGNKSFDVMAGWEARNKIHDDVMARGSDARRGATTVNDAAWGNRTVANNSSYYWTRPDGSIVGTDTTTTPQIAGGGWRMMSTNQ